MERIPALGWCLLSSLLLWLSYFPMNWGWLAWIALVPLEMVLEWYVQQAPACRSASQEKMAVGRLPYSRRPLLAAWLSGLAFCLGAFQWIRIASNPMYATWIILALIISLQWYFFFLFTRLLCQTIRLPLLLAAPITWTALEYIRSQIWVGFAWYYLGHTQHDELYFAQAADIFGVYGLSFIIMMVNVAIWRTISTRSWRVASFELVPAMILVGLACWHGTNVLTQDAQQLVQPQTKKIAILQGNQKQDLRNDFKEFKKLNVTYSDLGDEAFKHKPALILAPESCLSFPWCHAPKRSNGKGGPRPKFDNDLAWQRDDCAVWLEKSQRWNADLLFGFITLNPLSGDKRPANSALLLDHQSQERGCYDKIYCLPFGEYIPWADTLPFMKWLSPYPYEYTVRQGTRISTLQWDGRRIAPLICYEDTVPDLTRAFMRQENPDFFVNLSNDGWFKGWEEHEQHLVCARFRCIETRRAMVRAVNMGISCIIDGFGRIIALPAGSTTWHQAKNREAVIVGTVPLYSQSTLYVRWGDVLPLACWVVMVAGLAISFFRRRQQQ